MKNLFGTDGIRGEYGKNLTPYVVFSIGNALTQAKSNPKIVVGTDTRPSCDTLKHALCSGILQGGGNVVDVGIIPTAGISFLTQKEKFDFGVMITASHNPPEFNGVKIFNSNGVKLADDEERFLEEFLKYNHISENPGKHLHCESLKGKYLSHLLSCTDTNLENMQICLDTCNGASFAVAPKVFRCANAKVFCFNAKNDGEKINSNCGALYPNFLRNKVLKTKSKIGFCFDGDADRVIAISENGNIFDGDKLLYIIAKHFKENGLLFANSVVGTSHTNTGIMLALNKNKINLIRTDIGDKYVIEAMQKMNLSLGGEQSGHIILGSFSKTGDGILTALKICEIIKKTGKSLEELFDATLIPQLNFNVDVKDKIKILNNEALTKLITKISNEIAPAGRILVRASGTEEKIRIMIEHADKRKTEKYASQIVELIKKI